jgi:hypothetical protein
MTTTIFLGIKKLIKQKLYLFSVKNACGKCSGCIGFSKHFGKVVRNTSTTTSYHRDTYSI